MKIEIFPFQITNWSAVPKEEYKGETGIAYWQVQKINDIRNHLEHKFISIKLFNSELLDTEERERNLSISQDELEEKTIHLAKLVREALIYLSFSVHNQEKKL